MRQLWTQVLSYLGYLAYSAIMVVGVAKAAPPTVTVTVTASDTSGGTLRYRWASTDGTIGNVNASTTTWTLPNGPGLHFAYVLVSNGKGGYTNRRIVVTTDVIGSPPVIPAAIAWAAPAAAAQKGDYYRKLLQGDNYQVNSITRDIYNANLLAYVSDPASGKRFPPTSNVATDFRGQALIPGVPAGTNYAINCSADGGQTFSDCNFASANFPLTMLPAATSDYTCGGCVNVPTANVTGGIVLQDGTPCGTVDDFFGVHVFATATLKNASGGVITGPVAANEFGDYILYYNSNLNTPTSILLQCENATPIVVSLATQPFAFQAIVSGVKAPIISAMTATFNGSSVGTFLPPPSGLPSDLLPRTDGYLAVKGIDSRIGSCLYYKAVGAVKLCSAAGVPSGAINFEDWKRQVKIDKYKTAGVTEYAATYVNKVDLNLTRRHFSVSYGPSQTAAYVCNHLGPTFSFVTPQSAVDSAVADAVGGKKLVACVAMDYSVTTGVNGNLPLTRFLIFGPSGQLLQSVNLDGRSEKFVPGTCIVCHGGDHYAGKFPENGTGFANVGGHFLPYDTGNFQFSSAAGLTEANQEQAIYFLNQNLLNAGPTAAERELIAGWYGAGQVLNKNYLPLSWQGQSSIAKSFYTNVQARSCRSCHVALDEGYNFDHFANLAPGASTHRLSTAGVDIGYTVCGGSRQIARNHMMPNSLVTFNRLWLSYQNTAGQPDQPTILSQFYVADGAPCAGGIIP